MKHEYLEKIHKNTGNKIKTGQTGFYQTQKLQAQQRKDSRVKKHTRKCEKIFVSYLVLDEYSECKRNTND